MLYVLRKDGKSTKNGPDCYCCDIDQVLLVWESEWAAESYANEYPRPANKRWVVEPLNTTIMNSFKHKKIPYRVARSHYILNMV